jgi:hypothetical protein
MIPYALQIFFLLVGEGVVRIVQVLIVRGDFGSFHLELSRLDGISSKHSLNLIHKL